jgi:hypothetical protein
LGEALLGYLFQSWRAAERTETHPNDPTGIDVLGQKLDDPPVIILPSGIVYEGIKVKSQGITRIKAEPCCMQPLIQRGGQMLFFLYDILGIEGP